MTSWRSAHNRKARRQRRRFASIIRVQLPHWPKVGEAMNVALPKPVNVVAGNLYGIEVCAPSQIRLKNLFRSSAIPA